MAFVRARATALAAVLASTCCTDALALQIHRGVVPEDDLIANPLEAVADLHDSHLAGCRITAKPVVQELLQAPANQFKIHVHLHKAGGSLMCKMARQSGEVIPKWDWVEGANCNWMLHDDLADSGIPELFPNCSTRRKEYKKRGWTYTQIEREITHGDLVCKGFQYSCLLREPLDLIESNIDYEEMHYWGPGGSRGDNASVRVGHMRDLVALGIPSVGGHWDRNAGLQPTLGWKFMDNMQVRLLSGAIAVPPGKVTRHHLEMAKDRLKKFHVVAKLEDMDDPAKRDHVFRKMGWDISFEDNQCSANAEARTDTLLHEDRVWLRELNKWDYELYHWLDEA